MNHLFGSHKSIIKALKLLGLADGDTVSDWGCGGGDTLIAIAKQAQKDNINLKLQGIDAASTAIKFANAQSAACSNISYKLANVLHDDPGNNNSDFVICSLFTHHFADEEWIVLVNNMYRSARKAVVITDLHRHPVLYYAVMAITHLFTGNKMVKVDGQLSVKRSFKRNELVTLLAKANIKNYRLKWLWPFRWQIVIYKS